MLKIYERSAAWQELGAQKEGVTAAIEGHYRGHLSTLIWFEYCVSMWDAGPYKSPPHTDILLALVTRRDAVGIDDADVKASTLRYEKLIVDDAKVQEIIRAAADALLVRITRARNATSELTAWKELYEASFWDGTIMGLFVAAESRSLGAQLKGRSDWLRRANARGRLMAEVGALGDLSKNKQAEALGKTKTPKSKGGAANRGEFDLNASVVRKMLKNRVGKKPP